jgi:hypothetical protein
MMRHGWANTIPFGQKVCVNLMAWYQAEWKYGFRHVVSSCSKIAPSIIIWCVKWPYPATENQDDLGLAVKEFV